MHTHWRKYHLLTTETDMLNSRVDLKEVEFCNAYMVIIWTKNTVDSHYYDINGT